MKATKPDRDPDFIIDFTDISRPVILHFWCAGNDSAEMIYRGAHWESNETVSRCRIVSDKAEYKHSLGNWNTWGKIHHDKILKAHKDFLEKIDRLLIGG